MRIAIVSDIHSNLEALTRALSTIDELGIRDIVCLGDVVGYGANPRECLELVRARCRVVIKGNHDAAAADGSGMENFSSMARAAAEWTQGQLHESERWYLQNLPLTWVQDNLFFVHASPYVPSAWIYVVSPFEAKLAFQHLRQDICFLGHSHQPFVIGERGGEGQVQRGERFLINVGSVGQPRDGNPQLSFGVFDTEAWEYRNFRRTYDVEVAAAKILDAGLPRRLADRLFVGW
jgi:diadenosine tetraphosphatase ApaH/serine/threonine PP2A family protein phosphatase